MRGHPLLTLPWMARRMASCSDSAPRDLHLRLGVAHARLRRRVPAAAQISLWCTAEAAILVHSLTGANKRLPKPFTMQAQ
jgi:hypothetical protein